jgi:Holliday junction DNA helicase RuvB
VDKLDEKEVLRRAIELERGMGPDDLGYEWHQIPAQPATLNKLVLQGILKVNFKSHSSTNYRLNIPIEEAEKLLEPEAVMEAEEERAEIPNDLLDIIVGHDQAKRVIGRCLMAEKPVHVLLAGPPATAKSLFVMEISRLPNSRYALGSSSSKAGIVDFLLEQRPRYLIVDEIERMTSEDQSALLSLMESGIVTRLKKGMREKIKLNTLVFATCNRPERLPPELRSRFLTLHFREYSPDDFKRVVVGVLTRREETSPELAAYIADRLAGRTRDVRDAVRVARLCSSKEEVDTMIETMEMYKG